MNEKIDKERLQAGFDFLRRTGAKTVQLRYSDDEQPVVWFALASYSQGIEVDAGFDPVNALMRLCERLCDGGKCVHCDRPTGFEPDSLETMPANDLFCWYQYDPELKKFRRGCEGDN